MLAEVVAAGPRPAGSLSSLPVRVEVDELEMTFVADTRADGVGESDADGRSDEVDRDCLEHLQLAQGGMADQIIRDGSRRRIALVLG